MKIKKLIKYSEKFNLYLEKVSASKNPEQKKYIYNKILKIIKDCSLLKQRGKCELSPL